MESNTTKLEVNFEDFNISIQREESSNHHKTTTEDEIKSTKNKNTASLLTKRDSNKKPFEKVKITLNDKSEYENFEKCGSTKKDKAKLFVTRLRASTWSPRQSKLPEFDDIGLLHTKSEELEKAALEKVDDPASYSLHRMGWTELLYLPERKVLPKTEKDEECVSQNCSTHENANNTHDEKKHKDTRSRYDDTNQAYRIPGIVPRILPPALMDPKAMGTRKSNEISLKNGTISHGRSFRPPKDCEKKLCSTLSPNCTRRLRASSHETLPRVPSGKVNLVQSGIWIRLKDDDIPPPRNRSRTR